MAAKTDDFVGVAAKSSNTIFLVVIVGVVSLAVGGAWLFKKHLESQPIPEALFIESGVDPAVFAIAPVEKTTMIEEPVLEQLPEEISLPTAPPPPPPPATPEPVLKTELPPPDFMNLLPIEEAPKATKTPTPADIYNERCRGQVAIQVYQRAERGGGFISQKEAQWALSQKKWKEPRDIASLPVDLKRVLTVDRFIPAIVINAINSELSGKVVAQIERHVFAAHGRNILIPAGSKAVGYYRNNLKQGEERLMLFWERIITPEGINIHCGNAEMSDAMGRAGIHGEVDNRFFKKYGMPLLVSALGAAAAYAVPVKSQGQAVVIEKFSQSIGGVTQQMLQDHMNLKPVISIPAGTFIHISPMRDIWFKEVTHKRVQVLPFKEETK